MDAKNKKNISNLLDSFEKLKAINPAIISKPKAEPVIPPWVLKYSSPQLVPPFTWFGGKRKVARKVWKKFGADIPNYIEPFAGGLAVLLSRPVDDMNKFRRCEETFNDKNSLLLNFWRSVQYGDIEKLIHYAEFPRHETELLARRRSFLEDLPWLEREINNPDFYDLKTAGLWLYVTRNWINAGADDPDLYPLQKIPRKVLGGWRGGSARKHLTSLKKRLENAMGFVGDWHRVVESKTQTENFSCTGVFLDPPYRGAEAFYAGTTDAKVPERSDIADEVDEWALNGKGNNKKFRIAVCGYKHNFNIEAYKEQGWELHEWKPSIGHRSLIKDKSLFKDVTEITAFSPKCLPAR